jgi:hypothetical protein
VLGRTQIPCGNDNKKGKAPPSVEMTILWVIRGFLLLPKAAWNHERYWYV